jgi:hypothetical protein
VRKVLSKVAWKAKAFMAVGDSRLLSDMGYFQDKHGVISATLTETVLLCYKHLPTLPPSRAHVDVGSATYFDVISKVPVQCGREVWFLPKPDYATISALLATENLKQTAEREDPDHGGGSEEEVKPSTGKDGQDIIDEKHRTKRKWASRGRAMAQQPNPEDVVVFPHDCAGAWMKELLHESSGKYGHKGQASI